MRNIFISLALCGVAVFAAVVVFGASGNWFLDVPSYAEARDDHADHDSHTGHDHDEGAAAEESGSTEADGHTEDTNDNHGDHEHVGKTNQPHDVESDPSEENHESHEDHESQKGYEDHDGHDDRSGFNLTPRQMDAFDVLTATVSGGLIAVAIERPAEVVYDENALAHVVPRVAGIARTINATEGDRVAEGDVLAVLESRELADAKAAYLASLERFALAKENFARAEALIDKRFVSQKAHLEAKTDYAEARINLRNARQKLFALGLNEEGLNEISEEGGTDLTKYAMHAPLSGTVVARHLTRGESVLKDREAFIIADVSTVWVDISIYAHDLDRVESGQTVTVITDGGLEAEGTIAFVTPNVSEETRTASARVILENTPMRLRPGMFVTARIVVFEEQVEVRIPTTALQRHEGREVVFVKDTEGQLAPQPITLGRRNGNYVEVLAGLRAGDTVVTEGAFVVKSQLSKSDFDDGHNH